MFIFCGIICLGQMTGSVHLPSIPPSIRFALHIWNGGDLTLPVCATVDTQPRTLSHLIAAPKSVVSPVHPSLSGCIKKRNLFQPHSIPIFNPIFIFPCWPPKCNPGEPDGDPVSPTRLNSPANRLFFYLDRLRTTVHFSRSLF